MTSGLPQVCELWLGVSKGMLLVKRPDPKILMAVNYSGRQLAQRLGWAAPVYHKKDGANLHHGACRHRMQYGGGPDGRFEVRVWT